MHYSILFTLNVYPYSLLHNTVYFFNLIVTRYSFRYKIVYFFNLNFRPDTLPNNATSSLV